MIRAKFDGPSRVQRAISDLEVELDAVGKRLPTKVKF